MHSFKNREFVKVSIGVIMMFWLLLAMKHPLRGRRCLYTSALSTAPL